MKKILITFLITFFTIVQCQSSKSDEEILSCILNKFNLPHSVRLEEFRTNENYKKYKSVLRTTGRLCSGKFEDYSQRKFNSLIKSDYQTEEALKFDNHTIDCYRWHLLKIQPQNPIVKLLRIPENFDNGNCEEIINKGRAFFKSESYQTEETEACHSQLIEPFYTHRFIAIIILHGNFEASVIDEERNIFYADFRDLTEKLVECVIKNNP
ncbi:hypothetical protein PVAND_016274 [Polypedilum vanderplanki]|uniref:Lipoprotein n=1 Tax=Polypedilum vanderplanki TaxID=319348 RepID=A0A9J6BFR5_POLVA|nr:hypothetical protein PVAND_016274 [Polypedilum vanderplanki]